jgi:hypothetical protein
MDVKLVKKGLEELVKSIDVELAKVETRLEDMAEKFGLGSWKELEDFFKEGKDLPEVDLAWAEYLYLKNRRENLLKEREEVLRLLS